MRIKILCLLLNVTLLLPCLTHAQLLDSLDQGPRYQKIPIERHYRGLLLVPTSFILYGVASLKVNGLKSVNHHIKSQVHPANGRKVNQVDDYLQYVPGALVYGLNIAGIKGKHNFGDRTLIFAMANIFMCTTVTIGKQVTHEKRPDGSNDLSFPSGHTATAFAAAEFLMREYQDVSLWYGITGYAMAATTGYLRMSNNRHWLGDIVAGAGVGILSTELAYHLYPSVKRIFGDKKTAGANLILPTYQQGAVGLSMVHTFR